MCCIGNFPSHRHDGTAFGKLDRTRAKKALQSLGCCAVLTEVRGDWQFFKSCFGLPGWRENSGCCWLCKALPQDIRDASAGACWRQQRLSRWEPLARNVALGRTTTPLLSAPCMTVACFTIDWLHAMDLGVAADVLGNLLKMLLPKMGGANQEANCKLLFSGSRAGTENTVASPGWTT